MIPINKRKNNLRGQMEIMGLVVIVILISLGMLFMVKFAIEDNPAKKIFTRKGLAYSTVSAIMKNTIEDPNLNCITNGQTRSIAIGSELFDDCSLFFRNYKENSDSEPNIRGYSLYNCNQLHSCAFLEQTITTNLQKTLGAWNKKYTFESALYSSSSNTKEIIFTINSTKGACTAKASNKDSSGIYPLSNLQGGEVQNILYICE